MEQLARCRIGVLRGLRAQYGPVSLASLWGGRRAAGGRTEDDLVQRSAFRAGGPFFRSRGRRLGGHDQRRALGSGKDRRTVTYTKTETAGFYKALLTQPSRQDGRSAISPSTSIRGKAICGRSPVADLASRLAPLKYEFEYAAKYNRKFDETQGRNLGDSLLLLLLIVLIVEQWFAWSCSYHISSHMTNPWNPGASSK